MAFKMKGFSAHKGVSSPLNKVEEKVDIRDTRDKKRLDKAVEKGNQKRIDRIGERMSKRANKRKEGKTQVAPTSIPVNDPSMKNYNKAVDARVGKKIDTPKEEVKVDASSKVVTPKVTKVTPKPVKTLRGTGKTYKSAWEGMSAEKKAKFKGGYSEFETKAKAYNKKKDIKEGTRLKEGTQGPTKPYKNPKKQKGPLNKKRKY